MRCAETRPSSIREDIEVLENLEQVQVSCFSKTNFARTLGVGSTEQAPLTVLVEGVRQAPGTRR
jgi:hypothetical protein